MTVPSQVRDMMGQKLRDVFAVLGFQLILLILFGIFVEYQDDEEKMDLHIYPMFQDVHVMIFIGFGFLMTFLRRYGFSAVGFNFLLAALVIQWAIVCRGFFEMENMKIKIGTSNLLVADVASATVLISMGAVLGNTTYIQLIVMGIFEIAFFCANSYLGKTIFKAKDTGDSIFVHAFGAYFGLAVSFVLGRKKSVSHEDASSLEGSSYTSDLFAMIGTVFLWMFWPSFNTAELVGEERLRGIVNTYLALCACCVTAFAISSLMTPNRKFDMVHVQNSTLAGGVAIGTTANLLIQPYGAIIVGIIAAVLSVFGYSVITPFLNRTLKVHDTCGVHNLHGMPGVLAGLIGALMAGLATAPGSRVNEGTPDWNSTTTAFPVGGHHTKDGGEARAAGVQAGYQILAVAVTVAIAVVSGLVTGIIVKAISNISPKNTYNDDPSWLIHEHTAETPLKSEIAVTVNEILSARDPPMELKAANLNI